MLSPSGMKTTTLFRASALGLLSLFTLAIGCASTATPGKRAVYRPSEVIGVTAHCEKVCDVKAAASSLQLLCDAVVERTKDRFESTAKCKANHPLGIPTEPDAAVHDAAILDLAVGSDSYALLALHTDKGWELAQEIGRTKQNGEMTIVGARPVEVPELAPYAMEVRIRIVVDGEKRDRVFVCGHTSAGAMACPRAIVAS